MAAKAGGRSQLDVSSAEPGPGGAGGGRSTEASVIGRSLVLLGPGIPVAVEGEAAGAAHGQISDAPYFNEIRMYEASGRTTPPQRTVPLEALSSGTLIS